MNSDILSILLSFVSLEEKLATVRFVSKTWFHYCWLSLHSLKIDRNWNENWIKFLVSNVLSQNGCYKFIQELTLLPRDDQKSGGCEASVEQLFYTLVPNQESAMKPSPFTFYNLEELQIHMALRPGSLQHIVVKCPSLKRLRYSK